jgi:hypothetical protein
MALRLDPDLEPEGSRAIHSAGVVELVDTHV